MRISKSNANEPKKKMQLFFMDQNIPGRRRPIILSPNSAYLNNPVDITQKKKKGQKATNY